MAFCTKCGSSLNGAFCTQCGTPVSASSPAPARSPERKTSPAVWLLGGVLGLFCLSLIGVVGTGAYVAHQMRRNPQRAIGRLVEMHPDFEFVSSDDHGITIRSRRTGKRFSLSFDDARRGRFALEATDDEGRGGKVEVGRDAKIPSWVPPYPGSQPEPVISASGQSEEGSGEAGEFRFETPDLPPQVLSFYEDKAREMGLTMHTIRAGDTVTLATGEDEHDRMLKVIAAREAERTTVNVTYWRKR